jgi:hypothetical protein
MSAGSVVSLAHCSAAQRHERLANADTDAANRCHKPNPLVTLKRWLLGCQPGMISITPALATAAAAVVMLLKGRKNKSLMMRVPLGDNIHRSRRRLTACLNVGILHSYCNAIKIGIKPRPPVMGRRALPITAPKALCGSVAFIA